MPYVTEIEKHSWGKLASEGISLFPEHRLHLLMNGITSIIDMGAPLKSYQQIDKGMDFGFSNEGMMGFFHVGHAF